MKISFLEFLDRTGKHVSRKTFEKHKDERKIFVAWEVLIDIGEQGENLVSYCEGKDTE